MSKKIKSNLDRINNHASRFTSNSSDNKSTKYMNTPGKYLINNGGVRIPYTSFRYNWMQKSVLKKYRIHTTRHTFISFLHSAGVSEVSIKFIVGHSQVGVTDQVYVHKNLEELIREVNKLDYNIKLNY